ncbi:MULTISPECIES: hypothetical protein [Paenibacillus]|nr:MULTISPECIES: hypothetical protein [Paenibacillus]
MSAKRMPPTRKTKQEAQVNRKAIYIVGSSLLIVTVLLSVFILLK